VLPHLQLPAPLPSAVITALSMTPYPGSYDRSPCAMPWPMACALCLWRFCLLISLAPRVPLYPRGRISETGQATALKRASHK
jgi:hypothetical protein